MGNPITDLTQARDELFGHMIALRTSIDTLVTQNDQRHSVQMREWEPFRRVNGGTCDSNGAATITVKPAQTGWEAELGRISVTVSGASQAATVAAYAIGVQDTDLVDYAGSMYGNSPSRLVGDYNTKIYFINDEDLFIVIAGAVASAAVTIRAEGRRREV